jgi:hypothetical protein
MTREGTAGRSTFKDKTTTFTTKEGAVAYADSAPGLVAQAVRRYDRAKGGVQKFPLWVLGAARDLELTLEAKEKDRTHRRPAKT